MSSRRVRRIARSLLLACLCAGLSGARAQDVTDYPTVRHPEQFSLDWRGFYDERTRRTAAVQRDVRTVLDVAYGSDPKQRLDLYLPDHAVGAPILLFLHGGGFVEGDRAHYGYVAKAYVEAGVICAIASYRLSGAGYGCPAPLRR